MAGLGIYDLGMPWAIFRASRAPHTCAKFEKPADAKKQRKKRVRLLLEDAKLLEHIGEYDLAQQARQLARTLRQGGKRGAATMADPVRMRRVRIVQSGQLWHFLRVNRLTTRTHFFTFVPPRWQFTNQDLLDVDPAKLLNEFRSQIVRLAKADQTGILFTAIDVAHNPGTGVFQLHLHGIASGGLLKAVQALKTVPRFKSYRAKGADPEGQLGAKDDRVMTPVKVSHRYLHHLPRPLLYIMKQAWFAYRRDAAGKGGRPRRIPGHAHTIALLFRDRWDQPSLTLMMGMRVGRDGFKLR